jgi:agmatinase
MINLVGIPYDKNSSFLRGTAQAPDRIRQMETDGSANPYTERVLRIEKTHNYKDLGNLPVEELSPAMAFKAIRTGVSAILESKDKLLSLGGDHSVSYPVIDAHLDLYPDLHILQLDAHGDLYDNFDGNPYSHASPFARLMEKGKITSLTQIGVRTLNPHQLEQVSRFGVRVMCMEDYSPSIIHQLKGPLYISLDLDILDPAFAPGVSHHEPGGMTSRQLIHLIQSINVPIIGADIVECNPLRDLHNMTSMVAYKMMKELMAKMMEV